jgi:hypothetical protein
MAEQQTMYLRELVCRRRLKPRDANYKKHQAFLLSADIPKSAHCREAHVCPQEGLSVVFQKAG